MKKLDKLLYKSYIGPLLMTFFITLFVFDMQFLWKYIDDLIGKGLETSILFKLMFYASATMVPMALPLAVLLASIMTFGSFGEHFELTSIKSAGISLFRFMRPLIFFSIGLASIAFYFSNNVLPVANLKFKTLLFEIRHQKPALDFTPGFFNESLEGFSIRIEDKSDDDKTIYGVMIYDHTVGADNKHVIVADSAKFQNRHDGAELVILLYNGYDYKEDAPLVANPKNEDNHYKTKFTVWEKHFDLSDFSLQEKDSDYFSKMHSMLNLAQLVSELDTLDVRMLKEKGLMHKNLANYYINEKEKMDTADMFLLPIKSEMDFVQSFDTLSTKKKAEILTIAGNSARNVKNLVKNKSDLLKNKAKDQDRYWIEIHRKFSFSLACIVLFFIGAPLGAIVKKGGLGWPMVMAVLFFVLYHLLTIVGEKTALSGKIEIWQGMWLSTMILLPIGIFLIVKAKNDSELFNGEKFTKFFKKINIFKSKTV
ncbi:MAG: lipopolysaccharide export system permease protein [Planctomycetota bacterium]|jgi:lipopolysaccharide export system permease protein